MHEYWIKIGDRIVGDVSEFAPRHGTQQVVWLEMFVPTSELLEAHDAHMELIGIDGTQLPCRLNAFSATNDHEAEVLLEYLVPVA